MNPASRLDPFFATALVLVAALLLPASATAQTLLGRVLEDGRDAPVAGAVVSLVDRGGRRRAEATSDSLGRFRLAPPEAGEYAVESERLGYLATRSPLFALRVEGTVPFDVMMTPAAIGLRGFEVSAEREAEDLLGTMGLTPATLGSRWIDRDDLDAMQMPGVAKDVIRWQNIGGVWVYEGPPQLCVTFRRGRTFYGNDRCALTVLDGAVIPRDLALYLVPHDLEAIAVLTPVEATLFYGTEGGGGAVLFWTRRGRR